MERENTEGIRSLVERYCHVVGRNVAVEIRQRDGKISSSCLQGHNCVSGQGGCKNAFIGGDGS